MNFLWEREREEFEEDSAWEGRFQAWMGGKRKRKRSLEAWERERERERSSRREWGVTKLSVTCSLIREGPQFLMYLQKYH